MADPHTLDTGPFDGSTKLQKRKDVKDSVSSPPYHIDPSQTKITNPIILKFGSRNTCFKSIDDRLVEECSPSGLSLDLSGRDLRELPPDLSKDCFRIEELNLSNNFLTYSDLNPIAEMRRLKKLDVSGCGLKKLSSDDLKCWYEVEELNLSNNSFTHLDLNPERPMYNLKKLDLSGCGLKRLPPDLLKYCCKIEELNLSNNSFTHLDLHFRRPTYYRLKKLDVSGCGLKELPSDLLKYCYGIEELNLSNNSFTHLDLDFIRRMDELKKLDLSGCGLKELPSNLLEYCDEIEELNLSNNPFTHLDLHFIRPTYHGLKKLNVSGCGLKEFPCGLKTFLNVEELNLSNNFFDHKYLLEELNSGKKSGSSKKQSLKLQGIDLSRPARIIFEDVIYTKSSGGEFKNLFFRHVELNNNFLGFAFHQNMMWKVKKIKCLCSLNIVRFQQNGILFNFWRYCLRNVLIFRQINHCCISLQNILVSAVRVSRSACIYYKRPKNFLGSDLYEYA